MTTIKRKTDDEKFSLEVTGHAMHVVDGKDIVCSALSMLVATLACAIVENEDMFAEYSLDLQSGDTHIQTTLLTKEAVAVAECICRGFDLLEAEYPENICSEIL